MKQVSIKIDGIDRILRLGIFNQDFQEKADKLANRVLLGWERGMKQRVPVRTGTLRRSIYSYLKGFSGGYVSTNTNYAYKVNERSSRPHYLERTVNETRNWVEEEIDKFIDENL